MKKCATNNHFNTKLKSDISREKGYFYAVPLKLNYPNCKNIGRSPCQKQLALARTLECITFSTVLIC